MANQGGIKDIAVGRSDIYKMRPQDIHVRYGWNVRVVDFDPLDIDDLALARSIAENGVKEALTVIWDDGKAFVTNGHRRLAAARYAMETFGAEIKSIPCQTEDRYSSESDHVFSMLVRNSAKPLLPIEQAKVFKKLIDLGWSEADIARRVGKGRQWVGDLLALQAAPSEIVTMVTSGEVSATLAIQTIAKGRDKAAGVLSAAVDKAKGEGKSRATARHIEQAPTKADEIREIVATAKVDDRIDTVVIEMVASDFTRLCELVGVLR